jgi:uncharacterized OB-fold protein
MLRRVPESLPMTTHTIEFPYTRTLGPIFSGFLTGMRDGRILAVTTGAGKVICPPTEWDPWTGEAVDPALTEVGPSGTVETWAWVETPTSKHPLDHAFAFALIKLDGADTAMLHAVDAGDMSAMSTGMRVAPRWKSERIGHITDIEAFVPEANGG